MKEADKIELEVLEAEKLKLVKEYIKIQDLIDGYNEKVYHICTQIEILNVKIQQVKDKSKKKPRIPSTKNISPT